ncbi:organic hydroperoxide reductase OsmC/OhrA [Lewinella aquimaris]|uniref:Organic hydroperoxide reductase OsmC/OhrA n=1 Tax=Neolewinella aquimaris TaxID=1835722 RepID=A0A840E6M7_9BACT|nr:OsmC family protein [Neolewinella aquimaris]MBB4080700.1 organic hydroperoxide reductase OsmC/OhrA [Neolewinella aquimaris]
MQHHFDTTIRWTGNRGSGTLDYRAYSRDHLITVKGKDQSIEGSSDPNFRGDKRRYSPEELFVSSISACHMLWYLHLAAVNGITVLDYEDHAEGTMVDEDGGAGSFTSVTLRPVIRIAREEGRQRAHDLHAEAGEKCFIANSVKVPITYAPKILVD